MLPNRTLDSTVALLATMTLAAAQSESAWLHVNDSPSWDSFGSHVLRAVPTGGVIAGYEELETSPMPNGEAVFHRLTENGDVAWSVTRALAGQDFLAWPYHEYIADVAAGDDGEVAFAIGTNGPLELSMREPGDGSSRWTVSLLPTVGPHFEGIDVEFAPNGDLLVLVSEGLFMASSVRFDLYRLDASDGALLWSVGGPASELARMALDAAGNAYVFVDRGGVAPVGLERYDAFGASTGTTAIPGAQRPIGVDVDDAGRSVVVWYSAGVSRLTSIDAGLAIEWTTPLAAGGFDVVLAPDGHTIGFSSNLDAPYCRYDRQGAFVHCSTPENITEFRYQSVTTRPNGNSISLARVDMSPGSACRMVVEERDPAGSLVRSYEEPRPSNICLRPSEVAVDSRSNVHAIFVSWQPSVDAVGATRKLLFSDEPGVTYCAPAVPNSTGRAATVRALGDSTVATNNLTLLFRGLPPGATVLPLGSRVTGLVPMAGGSQGTLCLGGGVGRFDEPGEVRVASGRGSASVQLEMTAFPTPTGLVSVIAGETWNFQAWYRDANPGPTSNFTDAVSVSMQ